MHRLAQRVIQLGVRQDQSPAEVRRVETINLAALTAVFFNCLFNVLILTIGGLELWLLVITNSLSLGFDLIVLVLNRRGRTDHAMFLLFGATIFNLVSAALLSGLGTGVYLFLTAIPAISVVLTPSNDTRTPLVFSTIGLMALAGVVLANPPTPPAITRTALEEIFLGVSLVGTVAVVTLITMRFRHIADIAEVQLEAAHEHSERLLHNILPVEIAERLKAGEAVIADRVDEVSVLFADLVGSTSLAERLTADEMVAVLNDIFCSFDDLTDELGLEKIKTLGDAYLVVGGLPTSRDDHLQAIAEMALRMRRELTHHPVKGIGPLEMRFGIHAGTVVAGVIGKRKFSYDLWGDTVNTAARMESHGIPGEIQVTEDVYRRLRVLYRLEPRGRIEIAGKDPMATYFLRGRNAPALAARERQDQDRRSTDL